MKAIIPFVIASLLMVSPMGIKAQSTAVDFSQYSGSQVVNSDFEDWSGPNYSNVPVGWHSFESVTGNALYVGFAKSSGHTSKKTDDLHEGTIGGSCLKLVPRDLGLALANGTISTGRMYAGSMSASDPKNHAQMDISETETSNGSPFYAILTQRPTALSVWVKFTQGTPQNSNPYATISAAITNGNYYQEPTSNNDSSAVIGYAKNGTIETNNGQWQHLYVPFRYDSEHFNKTDNPQAIMVTISTNAKPGKGSVGDVLLVDDLELIYTQTLTIPESGFATFSNLVMDNHKVTIPEGLTAYTIEANGSGAPIVNGIYKAGQVLPSGTAVLLKGAPGEYQFSTTLYDAAVTVEQGNDICMVKASECNAASEEYTYYRLTMKGETLGFYPVEDGADIPQSEALLRVKADMAASSYPNVLIKPEVVGDINDDGKLNVSDIMVVVNRLLGFPEASKFLINDADLNGDNRVNVSDIMAMVNIILSN